MIYSYNLFSMIELKIIYLSILVDTKLNIEKVK